MKSGLRSVKQACQPDCVNEISVSEKTNKLTIVSDFIAQYPAVYDVGYCLDTPVRVPWEPLQIERGVVGMEVEQEE
jgi:hypothetical protein